MKRDVALVTGAFALCPLVAALAPGRAPLGHTRAVVSAERALGIYAEPAIHDWTRAHPALLALAGLFYIWVHFPATVGALVWARLERPHAFPAARDTFVFTQIVTVAGYLLYPAAPPRMLPGFTDTLAVVYGSGGERLSHSVQSPYAAMPSGHVAFAAVAGGIVFALVRSRALRALAVVYVMLVIVVVVSTANHLFLDAVGGLAAAGLGFLSVRGRKRSSVEQARAVERGMTVTSLARGPRVVVIGAGLGGLAVALRLQGQGFEVTVLEQCPTPGGRAAQLRTDGFTWDTGPSLITMPWVLEEAFAAGGLDLHSEVKLRRLDPLYRIQWANEERVFDFTDSRDGLREQIARFDARDAGRLDGFLDALRPIYEDGILGAGRRAFPDLRSFARLVPTMARLGAMLPLHHFVARHFRHPRVREAFSFHSLFIGGDPFRVPAIYGGLVYLQLLDGGWYSDGGVYSLVEAMARPLDVRCNARVEVIETAGDGVRGVRLASGERIAADVVISNGDVLRTHELLGRRAPRRRLRPTMSCFLLYLGCDRRFDSLLHHTLLVGEGYRSFIRDVTRGRGLPQTFSTYVHAPARTEPGMAAAGGDSLAVLLPVPNLRAGVKWERVADGLRDALVRDMETTFGLQGLSASVRVEHRMAPPDFASRFGAVDGNAFAVEPTLHQSAYFRAPNRVGGVDGLYHVGGGTHPGAGIPGVLLGAEVTAGLITSDVGVRA